MKENIKSQKKFMRCVERVLCMGAATAAFLWASPVVADAAESAGGVPAKSEIKYPQAVKISGYDIVKYEPQVEEWKNQGRLKARMALSIQKSGSEDPLQYASVEYEAETVIKEGMVKIGPRRITRWVFVDRMTDQEKAEMKAVLSQAVDAGKPTTVSLEDMTANLERTISLSKDVQVNLDPPPIFYADGPAVLVTFMGEPDFKAVDPKTNKVLFALNTNWDLLMDVSSSTYYLLIGDGWIKTQNLEAGPWKIVKSLPASFSRLPDDDNWLEVKKALKARPFELVPHVFISNQPSEMIETQGAPEMSPVSGTQLLYIKNTESNVFFYPADSRYYYLVEGRWFKSQQLKGPWKATTLDLPAEFAKIPEDHKKGDVLASVAGTDAAERAAVRSSIPQTATVDRSEAKLDVQYDGEPQFELIKGSKNVQYAVNTENDVFYVNSRYYSCYQGVWFEADSALGPWMVSDQVADDIYSIPATAPQHNVTYVRVYDSTPSTVQVGYTSGYSGQYLVRGLLVFGAGYWLGQQHSHHHYNHWYRPSYIGWGFGSQWSWNHHAYYRPNYWGYGPYGGIVRPTLYRGGHYYRPHYRYGYHRPGYHRPAYSPWHPPVVNRPHRPSHPRPTPYGNWGKGGVRLDDRLAQKHYNKIHTNQPIVRPGTRPTQHPGFNKPSIKPGPSIRPVQRPAYKPTLRPSIKPTHRPGVRPTPFPGQKPGYKPGHKPTVKPGTKPTIKPGLRPSVKPMPIPGNRPTIKPGLRPSVKPAPGKKPSIKPSLRPSVKPRPIPGKKPAIKPGLRPSIKPMPTPGKKPTYKPRPSVKPTPTPGKRPSYKPAPRPTVKPRPTKKPTYKPALRPSVKPRPTPSKRPTYKPTPKYKPLPKPTYRPTPKSKYKPAPKPTRRPVPKAKYKPTQKPTYRPAPKPRYRPAPTPTRRVTPKARYRPAPKPTYRPAPKPRYKPAPQPARRAAPRPASSHSKYQSGYHRR